MTEEPRIAAVVLAGGAGTRFGGRKQLAELEGRTLLSHALAAAAAGGARPVVAVLGAYAEEIEPTIDPATVLCVRCADWEEGQGASLRAGLTALPADADAALVTLGDEPYVSPAAAARLIAARRPGLAALRASYAGEPGHPVLIERALFPRLLEAAPGRRPNEVLAVAGVELIPCDDLGSAADVDTTEQLAALAAQRARPSRTSE